MSSPAQLNGRFRKWLSDYSMIIVLLFLVTAFSLLTIKPQSSSGEDAGRSVVSDAASKLNSDAVVLIIAPAGKDDMAFVDGATEALKAKGIAPAATLAGSPREARDLLDALPDRNRISAVLVTETSSQWSVFERYPEITRDVFFAPSASRWPVFLKSANLIGVANQTAMYAIIAIGMTMVIITGGIDLSVGSLVALSSVTCTLLLRKLAGGSDPGAAVVMAAIVPAILIAAVAGAFSGGMVTLGKLPSFIATLAMMLMARGLAEQLSNQQSIKVDSTLFRELGGGITRGLPNPVWLMLILYGMAQFIMSQTVFGRRLYAIGGNAVAARLCGIPVETTRLLVFTITGALAGLGGVLLSSRLNAGDFKYGDMWELEVIAAVVVGGCSLMGGEGRMFGTLIGAFIIAVIRNGMNLMGVESSSQKMVLGGVLLVSVLVDQVKRRWQRRAV